jgi:hypothetical protein
MILRSKSKISLLKVEKMAINSEAIDRAIGTHIETGNCIFDNI